MATVRTLEVEQLCCVMLAAFACIIQLVTALLSAVTSYRVLKYSDSKLIHACEDQRSERLSRFHYQEETGFHERHQLIKLQRLIQPYIDRITSLSLAAFHALEKLTMYTDGFDPMLVIAYSLLRLPRTLRRLKIVDLLFTLEILSDFIAHSTWAHLTHLEIMVEGLEAFTNLLRICPTHSSLKVIGLFTAFEPSETFTHTGLQSLHISGHWLLDSIGDTGLFDAITLPNLCTVEAHNIGSWPHEEFKALLTSVKAPPGELDFRW
ncbi:hypothetical protein EDB19DRAFT_1835413 [Suillus lakei]|nr:hypothetical protein EDB19DRAFT_1835413 [Suillus lakei]